MTTEWSVLRLSAVHSTRLCEKSPTRSLMLAQPQWPRAIASIEVPHVAPSFCPPLIAYHDMLSPPCPVSSGALTCRLVTRGVEVAVRVRSTHRRDPGGGRAGGGAGGGMSLRRRWRAWTWLPGLRPRGLRNGPGCGRTVWSGRGPGRRGERGSRSCRRRDRRPRRC